MSASPLLPVFAALSLIAVGLGGVICVSSGVPIALTARNLAAWSAGGALALALARWSGPRTEVAALILAPLTLAATYLHPGLQGVHRWVGVGPVMLNAALVVLPACVVVMARLAQKTVWSAAAAAGALALVTYQPDASQTTALAAAILVILPRARWPIAAKIGLAALSVLAVVASWVSFDFLDTLSAFIPSDPLAPVPEVEGVLKLAWALAQPLATAAAIALLATAAWPALFAHAAAPDVGSAGLALTAYFLATALTPFAGAFPVPLVGVGVSSVLGFWMGIGLLAGATWRATTAPR